MLLVSTRQVHVDATPSAVWSALTRVGDYQQWWPWLREFDGSEVTTGSVWRCVVRPGRTYSLRFTVSLDEVVAPTLVVARVAGDISGEARLTLHDRRDGCQIALSSSLSPRRGAVRLLATVAPPVARDGHWWVLDTGARQFAQRAL